MSKRLKTVRIQLEQRNGLENTRKFAENRPQFINYCTKAIFETFS